MKMKKQMSLLLLAAAPLALASCGATTASVIPAGGTSVENSVATPKLQAAVNAVGSDGAVGVKLSNFALNASAEINIPSVFSSLLFGDSSLLPANSAATSASSASDIMAIKGSASVSNVSFEAGVTGLNETDLDKVEGAAKAGADVAVDVHVGPSSVSYAQAGISAAAYLSKQNLYLDSSSAGFASAVNEVKAFFPSFDIPLGKYVLKSNVFDGAVGPLLNADMKTKIQAVGTDMLTNITTYNDYLKSYSYSDGRYFIGFDFSAADLAKFYDGVASQTNSAAASYAPAMTASVAGSIVKLLNVKSFKAGVVFTEKAFKGIAYDFDVSLDTTLGAILDSVNPGTASLMGSSIASLSEKYSFKAAANLDVLNGDEVKVSLPSDLSTYGTAPSASSSAASK